jgi:16S rRNA A1518/A1519 N6-dimethyltransferase RsmA/KsgA/DIM1 with predicted DNA glycosylase/AP lyase activity
MVAIAGLVDGMTVLEPSAGTGRILDAIADTGANVQTTACEICPTLCGHLFNKYGATLRQGDFLGMQFPERFDRIIMNPPFRRGTDVLHISHALRYLKPGGKLVSLCYDGVAQNARLRPMATTWETLPPGTFKESGTGAGVCLLTIESKT